MSQQSQSDALRRAGDVYGATIDRLEPDIAATDLVAFGTSAAISLKRIADNFDKLLGMAKETTEPHVSPATLTALLVAAEGDSLAGRGPLGEAIKEARQALGR